MTNIYKNILRFCIALLLLFVAACSERTSYQNIELNEKIAELLRETTTQISNNPDSVLSILTEILNENRNRLTIKTKAALYRQIGVVHAVKREFDLSDLFYSKAFQFAKKEGDTIIKARAKTNMGSNQFSRGNIQKSIDYHRQARLILGSHKNAKEYLGVIYVNLSNSFALIGDSELARYYIQLAIDAARQVGDKRVEARAFQALGIMLSTYHEHPQAELAFRSALELAKDINDKRLLGSLFSNLSIEMFLMNRNTDVLYYLERSEEITQILGVPNLGRISFYVQRGEAYIQTNEYTAALAMFNRALELRRELGCLIQIAYSYSLKSLIYNRIGNYDKTLYYANKALKIAKGEGLVNLLDLLYEDIAYAHAKQGNIEKFSQAMALSRHYRDSIFTQQRFAAIQELQTRFQTEQKQQEIIQQQKEIQAHRAAIAYLTIICVLIAILLTILYIFHRKKLQQQMQIIRQHEELSSYVRKKQPQAAEDTVELDAQSEELLNALDRLFEREKLYRDADLNINKAAERLDSNRDYLSKAINQHRQKNFSDYVNYYRIEEAKEILKAQNEGKYTNYTNEYIAEIVGFGSSAQFYRAFKQVVGVTSSEYKKAVKKVKLQPAS